MAIVAKVIDSIFFLSKPDNTERVLVLLGAFVAIQMFVIALVVLEASLCWKI